MKFSTKVIFSIATLFSFQNFAQNFQESFKNPGKEARPRVWWHWMNGNITKDGIKKDLEWMEKSGIAGFQNFDANLFTPVIVEKKIVYMTPEWKDAFHFTTKLAKEKNLEMAIAGSPGWSVTGGPWVKPEDAMKKYTWALDEIKGGKPIKMQLKSLPDATGIMQDIGFKRTEMLPGTKGERKYAERVAVLAFPNDEISLENLKPTISSNGGKFTLEQLTNGILTDYTLMEPGKAGEEKYIQYQFEKPVSIQALTFSNGAYNEMAQFNGAPDNRKVQFSNDGINFKDIIKVPRTITGQVTLSFEPISAKYFRLIYTTLQPTPGMEALFGLGGPSNPVGTEVSEFKLYANPRIHLFEGKAGFEPHIELQKIAEYSELIQGIPTNKILDISQFVDKNGILNWKAPKGRWTILQLGFSITGRENHPASPEATGLEVDKLNKEAVSRYLRNYLEQYKNASQGMLGNAGGLTHMVLDSYEAGHMTWTQSMEQEFKKRRGYELRPFMPVLAGIIVDNLASSEKFLWDFRKTIGELIVENHYEVIGSILTEYGMKRYTESHENGRIYLADGMDVKRKADVPMSAMWQPGGIDFGTDEAIRSRIDIRESASVANIYGQNIAAAESMTSIMKFFSPHPGSLKRTADMELASGLNRFVIHTSVHQPLDDKRPGFSLGPFGQYFSRQETWANQAKVWIDYLSRSSFMLQQGKNVADILVFYGENVNLTSEYATQMPPIPAGFEFDFINSSALKDALEVEGQAFISKGGNRYQVLFLDKSAKEMTISTLKRIRDLAKMGGLIVGNQPINSPSLGDNSKEFNQLIKELYSFKNVYFNNSLEEVLKEKNIRPDVIVQSTKSPIFFRHRKDFGKDIYWILNHQEQENSVDLIFNIRGKLPQKFNPETGEVSPIAYKIKEDGTHIQLEMSQMDAQFIVFEGAANQDALEIPIQKIIGEKVVEGSWQLDFQKDRNSPGTIVLDQLISLNQHENPQVKYFSGEMNYSKFIHIENTKNALWLDLGEVANMVEVSLNGQNIRTLWKAPFRLDISKFVKLGENKLELKVVNSWVNRLVGDTQPEEKNKSTFIVMPLFNQYSKTEKSGLIGPVKLLEKGK